MNIKKRCDWCLKDEIYMDYHDNVWGKPEYDDIKLFEFLNLEGAQAGLSWYTVLIKIDNYRQAFHNWDPEKIAAMGDEDIEKLMQDKGIIRNRLKIQSVITNARAFLDMKNNGESFSEYLWSFVDGKPLMNSPESMADIPAKTEVSDKMSKELKKKGFKFVGSTICYAFMQAVGMVDDHLVDCFVRK
ncbi:DNA-3-methyladenine glycosylase I [Marinigracilibium pacificum]|uniref:DNA-3-methyladenine glycosylase I n=1 Tax=Marinigracilibium pacificum TaxID=2729599 RepID=A0A848IZK1_9BACT|nr:DNA-3-methyladenine glycosylase I [Marinigracilibium pacificum]NMM49046.1 DNA-3-methyladenine glycosylase I [Marinigracilibium pacificum]